MMKQILFFLSVLFFINSISFAQKRSVARGAEPGELYLIGAWYGNYGWEGPPSYSTIRLAVYRFTENGKKMTMQYDAEYFTYPEHIMHPEYFFADATPGVVYNVQHYPKNDYPHTALWVSFDYGKNWIFREENIEDKVYYIANVEGLIYRAGFDGYYKSEDYGDNFYPLEIGTPGGEHGLQEGEVFGLSTYKTLLHTYDLYITYTEIPIESQFVGGLFPDVYRGGLPGEVYVDSYFPDWSYKVSFSADTGHTFRHVFSDFYDPTNYYAFAPIFMSDREPGVFYILRGFEIADTDPWGWHTKFCIEYYRDYGETLEAVFCHDITRNYEYEEVNCDHTTWLESKVENDNSIQLQWSSSAESSLIRGYHLYRNNIKITSELLTETIFFDENLTIGEYDYYVKTYYKEGCVSDASNHVKETIELGIKEFGDEIVVYPNPTDGTLHVISDALHVTSVEVFDVYGRKQKAESRKAEKEKGEVVMNISDFHTGIYFVKITTEKGIVSRKVVKY